MAQDAPAARSQDTDALGAATTLKTVRTLRSRSASGTVSTAASAVGGEVRPKLRVLSPAWWATARSLPRSSSICTGHRNSAGFERTCSLLFRDPAMYTCLHVNPLIPLGWELAGHPAAAIVVAIFGAGTGWRLESCIALGAYIAGHLLLTFAGAPLRFHSSTGLARLLVIHTESSAFISSFCFLNIRYALAPPGASPFGNHFLFALAASVPVCACSCCLRHSQCRSFTVRGLH